MFLTKERMEQFIIGLNIAVIFWSAAHATENGNEARCQHVTPPDLIPLFDCSVTVDDQRFLYASCDINCFARAPKPVFQGNLYTILASIGYKSFQPLTSESESVCLWMTNITIRKTANRYSRSHGTPLTFDISDRAESEVFTILDGSVTIQYPAPFRRTFGVAHPVNSCSISSQSFDISTADKTKNSSCKVEIFGMKTGVFSSVTSPPHYPLLTMDVINVILFEKAVISNLRVRFKSMRERQKDILPLIGRYTIIKFEFIETNFDVITDRDFQMFSTLEVLNLTRGSIRTVQERAFLGMTKLSVLDLSYNRLHYIPLAALDVRFLPKLAYVTVEGNVPSERNFTLVEDFESASPLFSLTLSKIPIYGLDNYSFVSFPKLKNLYLDRCHIVFLAREAFFELYSLRFLTLARNRLTSLPEDVFLPLVSLKHLDLGRNKIKVVSASQLSNLESLNLERNLVGEFPHDLPPSLQKLNLRANRIKSWIGSLPVNLSQLRELDLSSNNISVITKEMQADFDDIDRVNLSMNPYDCTPCPLYLLNTWLQKPNAESPDLYICSLPPSLAKYAAFNLNSHPEDCLEKTINIAVVCTLALIIVLAISSLSCIAYFRRWKVRYFYLKLTSLVQNYKKFNAPYEHKDYDAYISYAPPELGWLTNELIPRLESGENGLRLYIHDRNAVAGNDISENIIEYIKTSHYVVLILSEAFIAATWCQLEMYIAYQELLEETINGLILLKVGNISASSVGKLLNYLMKTRTYLEWPSTEDARQVFWERLKRSLSRTNEREKMFNPLV